MILATAFELILCGKHGIAILYTLSQLLHPTTPKSNPYVPALQMREETCRGWHGDVGCTP